MSGVGNNDRLDGASCWMTHCQLDGASCWMTHCMTGVGQRLYCGWRWVALGTYGTLLLVRNCNVLQTLLSSLMLEKPLLVFRCSLCCLEGSLLHFFLCRGCQGLSLSML